MIHVISLQWFLDNKVYIYKHRQQSDKVRKQSMVLLG